ncbi:MAG: hypothetical protein HQM09_08420 [Candidatus Riflebacteria bacterium]|nr:hypothetical protein [Candidatus Riflebacteria bacterium]
MAEKPVLAGAEASPGWEPAACVFETRSEKRQSVTVLGSYGIRGSILRGMAILCLFLIVLPVAPVLARQAWMTWNTRSGLPSNDVLCLAIMKGKIAVGTPSGIAIFQENRPTWINLSGYGEEFGKLVVRALDFDEEGNLWAATPNGLAFLDMGKFPEEPPRLEIFGMKNGLSTIDVEVLQVVGRTLYVGCFGGWLFQSQIGMGAAPVFRPVQNMDQIPGERRLMDVGVSALAMDFPGGGIFSTKGKGLCNGQDGAAYLSGDASLSDWIEDFWCFQEGNSDRVITLAQNQMTLIQDRKILTTLKLPDPDAAVTCLTTCPDEDVNVTHIGETPEQTTLRTFLGKRILYVGTKGQGVWRCKEGQWSRMTTADSPMPSDNINRIHYLPGAKRIALLTDCGLTLFGTDDMDIYDEFKTFGTGPSYAKSYFPFMSRWGPPVVGYPSKDAYPVEPHITYRKLFRNRDLWVSHDKGISRFAFPQAFFLGSIQTNYRLSGRFENPQHDPAKNILTEDNSTTAGKPPSQPGERIWHHYCMENPADTATTDLSTLLISLDRTTLAGPLNQLTIQGASPGRMTDALTRQVAAASGTLRYPSVLVFEEGSNHTDVRGQKLFSVDSLFETCPIHPIPGLPVTDFTVDAAERCWAVIGQTTLVCLDEPTSVVPESSTRFESAGNYWHEFSADQLPWPVGEKIKSIRRVGVDLYFGTEKSGLFILHRAHLYPADSIPADAWVPINPGSTADDPTLKVTVIDCVLWRAGGDSVVALLNQEGLSLYDGSKITSFAVPKRHYTCICADRTGSLWLGSFQGLLKITPDRKVELIDKVAAGFRSDRIVSVTAAPDDAKYPFLIAVALDESAKEVNGIMESDCRIPFVGAERTNPYRLRFGEPEIMDAQLVLYDGKQWDTFRYPGIHHLLFEEMYLWSATSFRVFRYYVPKITQVY